jgi:hypothetical protein
MDWRFGSSCSGPILKAGNSEFKYQSQKREREIENREKIPSL